VRGQDSRFRCLYGRLGDPVHDGGKGLLFAASSRLHFSENRELAISARSRRGNSTRAADLSLAAESFGVLRHRHDQSVEVHGKRDEAVPSSRKLPCTPNAVRATGSPTRWLARRRSTRDAVPDSGRQAAPGSGTAPQ